MRQSTNTSSNTSINEREKNTTKIEDSAKSMRKDKLNERVSEILDDCVQLKQEEHKLFDSFSDRVRFLGLTLEEIFDLSDMGDQIDTICGMIIHLFHERGIEDKDVLIRWALPDKFRRAKDLPEEEESLRREAVMKSSAQQAADKFVGQANRLIAQSKNIFDLAKPEVLEKMPEAEVKKIRDQLRTFTESVGEQLTEARRLSRILGDQLDVSLTRCEQLGIAVDPDKASPPKDVVSSQPIKSGYSRFYDLAIQFSRLWQRIAEKIWKYKPLTDEQIEHLADIMELQIQMDKPLADEKFRLDTVQWLLAGAHEAMEGKHAAAERYHYMLPKQTRKELDRLGEDVAKLALDPDSVKARIEIEKVAIVREQVGDVREAIFRLAANILLMLIPRYIATVTWFTTHPGWSIAKRKQEAHDKLSKAA